VLTLLVVAVMVFALGWYARDRPWSHDSAPQPGIAVASPEPEQTLPSDAPAPEPTDPDSAAPAETSPEAAASPESSAPAPAMSPESGASTAPIVVPSPEAALSPEPGASGPKLAIIIDDCGQWIDIERAMIALPITMTFSIMPEAPYTGTVEHEAAAAQQGIMLHLPMEPMAHMDPGPGRIMVAMDDAAITAQVRSDLARVPLARGVNNHEGSRATQDPRVMHDVVSVLADEHRFFIDSLTIGSSVAGKLAAQAGIPTASRDVFLDDQDSVAAVEAQLRIAAAIAEKNGSAIAIGHPRAATLAAIRALYPEFQARGIAFVPAEQLVH
jgi:polysaccharide deacetylase 2 family uncharacterized protein YibQ